MRGEEREAFWDWGDDSYYRQNSPRIKKSGEESLESPQPVAPSDHLVAQPVSEVSHVTKRTWRKRGKSRDFSPRP
jgi:hypothetical protein